MAQQRPYHDAYALELAAPKTYYAQTHELETPVHEMAGHPSKSHEMPVRNNAVHTGVNIETR
jgi:hypothetical protein